MSVSFAERTGDNWEDRVRQVIRMTEEAMQVTIPNPEDLYLNVVCNDCGKVAASTIEQPPVGWKLGRVGEDDFCDTCMHWHF